MVMYLGAEKAGIRLADYRRVPLRVGELMFDDRAFSPVKGKTDELFSVLFHRRFVAPDSAWSETTAYPADRLSAEHLAAKLVISTIADVRHTMFMSGITPFRNPTGPRWRGDAAPGGIPRAVGRAPTARTVQALLGRGQPPHRDDRPFSLFWPRRPFEVTDRPARDGYTFLSDADAAAAASRLVSSGTRFLCRSTPKPLLEELNPAKKPWKRSSP